MHRVWADDTEKEKMTSARFELAGVSHRLQDYGASAVKLTDELRLVPEPDNMHDSNAIAVYKDSFKIGYVPRSENKVLYPYVMAGKAVCVVEAATSHSCWVRVDMP
jgi:hypothetical protein